MITCYEKVVQLQKLTGRVAESQQLTKVSPNPVCPDGGAEYIPLWMLLLPENSEHVKLPVDVNDAVYSPAGDNTPNITYNPRAGLFERLDAQQAVRSEALSGMSYSHQDSIDDFMMSDDQEKFIQQTAAAEAELAKNSGSDVSPSASASESASA